MSRWYEIHGFASPIEFDRFVEYLRREVAAGYAEEVATQEDYGRGEIYGGSWYRDGETGEIWRLVPPDPPFHGLWERVSLPD
jgi:hypothetical protein